MIGSLEKIAIWDRYYSYVNLYKEGILYVGKRFAGAL